VKLIGPISVLFLLIENCCARDVPSIRVIDMFETL